MLADLHIHTTFSDGINTPEAIVRQAVAAGLSAIAITDHDNVRGCDRAMAYVRDEKIPLKVLRGVEIDTNYKGKDVHVLGYHFSETEPALRQAMAWNRSQRVDRAQRITEKIHSLGYDITSRCESCVRYAHREGEALLSEAGQTAAARSGGTDPSGRRNRSPGPSG